MMQKWISSGILFLLSLFFLKFGLLSYEDASIYLRNFNFNNIFFNENWNEFKNIFLVYSFVSVVISILTWVFNDKILIYLKLEKRKIKFFLNALIAEAKNHKLLYLSLLILFTIGISLRLFCLNRPMRYDEAFTFLEYGKSSIGYISMNYSYPNNHILHSIILRIFTILFGDQLWIIRLPAFIGGVLALVFTFFVGRKWFGLKAGILGVALVVFSEMLIDYSVNARGYALQTALFLAVLFLIIENNNKTGRWIVIAILNAVGFWLIPSYLFCFGIILFIYISKHGLQKQLISILGLSFLLGFILYLPVIAYMGKNALTNNPLVKVFDSMNYLQEFIDNLILIYGHLTPGIGIIQGIVFVLLISTSFQKKTRLLSLGVFFTIALLIAIIGKHAPPRIFLFILPLSALLISGSSLVFLDKLSSKFFLLLLMLPLLSWGMNKNRHFDYEEGLQDIPELVKDLKSKNRVGVVSKIPVDYPVRYYLSQNPDLNSSWNRFGSDTVYVIVNEFYKQDLTKTFGEKSKGYHFQKVKKYKYSTLFIGLRN